VRAFRETIHLTVRPRGQADVPMAEGIFAPGLVVVACSSEQQRDRGVLLAGLYPTPGLCLGGPWGSSAGDSCDCADAKLWLGGTAERLMFLFTLSAQSAPAELKGSRYHPSPGGYRPSTSPWRTYGITTMPQRVLVVVVYRTCGRNVY
jgi:hypothetical protein